MPKIYWEQTTKRVLTMEYFDGGFVNDIQYIRSNDISVSDVSGQFTYRFQAFLTGIQPMFSASALQFSNFF